jgi:hypothetical protein
MACATSTVPMIGCCDQTPPPCDANDPDAGISFFETGWLANGVIVETGRLRRARFPLTWRIRMHLSCKTFNLDGITEGDSNFGTGVGGSLYQLGPNGQRTGTSIRNFGLTQGPFAPDVLTFLIDDLACTTMLIACRSLEPGQVPTLQTICDGAICLTLDIISRV